MGIIVTYDVSKKQDDVKADMLRRGYLDRWDSEGKTYYLPNTTLWKKNTEDLAAGLKDIQDAAGKAGVRLERAIVLSSNPWKGIPGDPHSP